MSTPHRPGTPSAAVINGVDVVAVAAAVQSCAGVSALDSGRFGEVESYLPGRRVPGVVVRDQSVLVGVRSRWGVRAADLFAQIASAVAPLIGRRWVEVAIGDMDDPPGPAASRHPALKATTKLLTLPRMNDVNGKSAFPDLLLRRTSAATHRPAYAQVSGQVGVSASDREFSTLTGRSGTQRARRSESGS